MSQTLCTFYINIYVLYLQVMSIRILTWRTSVAGDCQKVQRSQSMMRDVQD